jgi:hypothetical protein
VTTAAQPQVAVTPPPLPPDGFLRLDLDESAAVYLDGERVNAGPGAVTLSVAPNAQHRIELRNLEAFACKTLGSFTVAPGDTHALGRVAMDYGYLTLAANAEVSFILDGSALAGVTRSLARCKIGEGEHTLSVSRAGLTVERAFRFTTNGQQIPLERIGGDDQNPNFRVRVPRDDELRLGFVLK